jgi:4-hydroxy-3-methylbut-2-enyl diphosphate reductase IspH
MAANRVNRVLLAAPRGYCAGVDRAVETVEWALATHGQSVYVRKEIVPKYHVVAACNGSTISASIPPNCAQSWPDTVIPYLHQSFMDQFA